MSQTLTEIANALLAEGREPIKIIKKLFPPKVADDILWGTRIQDLSERTWTEEGVRLLTSEGLLLKQNRLKKLGLRVEFPKLEDYKGDTTFPELGYVPLISIY